MAVQSSFYTVDGKTRTFPSSKHIPTKQHMAVWVQRLSDGVYEEAGVTTYELIQNSAVLVEAPSVKLYQRIEVRVADNPNELTDSVSDIAVVSSIASEIVTITGIKAEVIIVAGNSANITTVAGDTLAINVVAGDSTAINTVAGDSAVINVVAGDTLVINDLASEPLRTAVLNAATNAGIATDAAVAAALSESNAAASETSAQLDAWIAEAEAMTAESNANEAVNVFTKTYTSNGDGTFSSVNNAWYSAYHYAQKAISGGTERTSARNTILSTAAAGAIAQAVTPTPSFNTVIYTGNGTSQSIVTGLKSYDPNWVSGRAYSLLNEQDAYCIHNYYIYKLLADVTSATTPDADPTKWEVVADGESVPWFNSQVWVKSRSVIDGNYVFDTIRGAGKRLVTDSTVAEGFDLTRQSSFNIDGFSVGTGAINTNLATYVAWQEQFDTMVSGTTNQGKRYITASNAQSGKFMGIMVGSGTAGHEIPHGVGTKPDFTVFKSRGTVNSWIAQSSVMDTESGEYMLLDTNAAKATSATIVTRYTDSVVSIGSGASYNTLNDNLVFYGSSNRDTHTVTKMYQGTGLAGKVVDLGLDMTQAGAKVMIKRLTGGVGNWIIRDNVRGNELLWADITDIGVLHTAIVLTESGITITDAGTTGTVYDYNTAGSTYLIEATVPNYDKPNGGLNRPAGNIYSFAEGVDSATGDKDAIEVSTSVDFTGLTAGAKNYLFADKGNTLVASIYPMIKQIGKTLDANSYIYDVETGTVLSPAGVESSRQYLGEAVIDGGGEVIPETIKKQRKTNDFVDVEVHGDAKFHGGFDLGQTWVNETANRLSGVTYKNEGNKHRFVSITIIGTTTAVGVTFNVDGKVVSRSLTSSTTRTTLFGFVPIGVEYILPSGSFTITDWYEYK